MAIKNLTKKLITALSALDDGRKIEAINTIKTALHSASPMRNEPVDCVTWVKPEQIAANDYNPNQVAPPEMRLLELSIANDGYTQPIVIFNSTGKLEIVDGFHRSQVGLRSPEVRKRTGGYVPVTAINRENSKINNRMASTIRHNRARGKHRVGKMSEIITELKRRRWSDSRIAKELGMDADEVLRLSQISGLVDLFRDKQFSTAWELTGPK